MYTFSIKLIFLFSIVYLSSSEECGILPGEQYDLEQSVFINVDYYLLNDHGNIRTVTGNSRVNLKHSDTLVGVPDYCEVMDTRIDGVFYSAVLPLDVLGRYDNSVELCFIEFYNKSSDSIVDKALEDPYDCIEVNVVDNKLEFQAKNILRKMLANPIGTLSLFTIKTVSSDCNSYPQTTRSRHIRLDLSDSGKLELIIPSIETPGPMPEVPSLDGNDYQHLFPGAEFHHPCTIPDSELDNNQTNPSKCYGRDAYVLRPRKVNPLGPCIYVILDGMPSEGAMHHHAVINKAHIPGEEPFRFNDYCTVVVSTRIGSGTNTPTPPTKAWSWNLVAQARENLRFLIWAQSLSPGAHMTVETHDRGSIAVEININQDLINTWAELAGWEQLDTPIDRVIFRDSWLSICDVGEEYPGVCSESTLFNGLPAPYKPMPACELAAWAAQMQFMAPLESCNCNHHNLFLTPFITEWGEADSIEDNHPETYRECTWRRYGYEDNYHFYDNLENPDSKWRKCAAKWRDPFTDEVIPAAGFLLDGSFGSAYNFNTCTPISTNLRAFTPQAATPTTVLPDSELKIFSYGSECETRFNSTEQQLQECLNRRFGKSKDPKGAVMNTQYHQETVFPQTNLTGVETYHAANLAVKNGPNAVRIIIYHTGPNGLLNPNKNPEFLRRTLDNTYVLEGRGRYSHFMTPNNPYASNIFKTHVDILDGIIPDDVTL